MADEINFSKSDALIYEKIEKEIGMFPEVYCFTSDGFQDIMQELPLRSKRSRQRVSLSVIQNRGFVLIFP